MADPRPLRRALLSVSDKTGLVEFAQALAAHGVELLSTGGTAAVLREAGLAVVDVAQVTGFPEMMDGRIKTLHPRIHGGLLARREVAADVAAMEEHGIPAIDLLVVNLYPFETTQASGADFVTCIENIDIGGPAMIRAAAKNHADVAVVTDPADYPALLQELAAHGGIGAAFRRVLAQRAFARTAAYDAAVSNWLAAQLDDPAPRRRAFAGVLAQPLRYGENPHQRAAFYADGSARAGIATAQQLQGKELSWNNINDTDAAFELVAEFGTDDAACVIVKHANPCGVALGADLHEAWQRALACDPTSAFGGIVALNRPLDAATAQAITEIFTEVVIAPGADDAARAVFADRKNLRLLLTDGLPDPAAPSLSVRQVAGGFLVQDRDNGTIATDSLQVVTQRAPSPHEMADLLFAWRVVKHVKSNAIVLARDRATLGIGAGQTSRVDSARIAAGQAGDAAGAVVASDAFFPFADGLLAATASGARAVIQPGGSMRDAEVIAAADAAGIAMVLTGLRHFRH